MTARRGADMMAWRARWLRRGNGRAGRAVLAFDSAGRSLPLGRVAEVEDVAKAYLQLMDQDYATGTVSVIDGGTILA